MRIIRFITLVICIVGLSVNTSAYAKTLTSTFAKASFEYQVILPDDYAANNHNYPLLLILDGQNYGELVSNNAIFLADAGDIPAHVIVSLNVVDRLKHYTPTDSVDWVGDGGGPQFYQFIEQELLPKLNQEYRLSEIKVLWGHSAAGLYTMYAFLQGDSAFNAFLVNDGSLDWDNHYVVNALKPALEKARKKPTFLYINHSFLDPNAPQEYRYIEPILSVLATNQDELLTTKYQAMPNETHGTIPLMGSIDGLRTLYQGYRIPERVIFSGLKAVKHYFQAHKNAIGARDYIPVEVIEQTGLVTLFSDPKASIKTFEYGLTLYPHSINLHEFLADAYVNSGETKQAKLVLSKGITLAEKIDSSRAKTLSDKLHQIVASQ